MKILLLGGTGAMGQPLAEILSKNASNEVFVTSRSVHESFGRIKYVQGNAKDIGFLGELLTENFDVIVDFMAYTTEEFLIRNAVFSGKCQQYVFLSSARVYADFNGKPIVEGSPRLLDVCKDEEYLKTDEYALAKARQENILRARQQKDWTIVRPYITYFSNRFQLGVFEKEMWLERALNGQSIVFTKDIAEKQTTLTYGYDAARVISALIGNKDAFGEDFNVVTSESKTWGEILNIYVKIIEEITGNKPKVKFIDDANGLRKIWNKYQIDYDRLFNRVFDNRKILETTNITGFNSIEDGLMHCLNEFIKSPQFSTFHPSFQGWADRYCREWKGFIRVHGLTQKLRYLKNRFGL